MTAQRLSILLTVFVYIHLVYSEILAQDDHISEGESTTESGIVMADTILRQSEISLSTTANPSSTVILSSTSATSTAATPLKTSSSTDPTIIHPISVSSSIEEFQRLAALLLGSTNLISSTQLKLEKLKILLSNTIPIQQMQQHLQVNATFTSPSRTKPLTKSTAKDFDGLTTVKKLSTTTVRGHYRRKMKNKNKKPCRVATKKPKRDHKEEKKLKTCQKKLVTTIEPLYTNFCPNNKNILKKKPLHAFNFIDGGFIDHAILDG